MKRISFITLALIVALTAFCRQPQQGYRGFLEWSNSVYSEPSFGYPDQRNTYFFSGASTSHGYQITPVWFVGAGISMEYNGTQNKFIAPVFLQGRADFKFGIFSPFADARLGYSLTDGGGLYFSPSIGYRFNWGRKMGINVGVGLTVKGSTYDKADVVIHPDGYCTYVKVGTWHDYKSYFSFRVGFDF